MRIETLAVHAGQIPDPATGAVAPPIHLSTTFERAPDGEYPHGLMYSRMASPNRTALERCLASLDGGVEAAAFSSGQAAASAVLLSLRAGDHVIAPLDAYYGTGTLMRTILADWGLESTFVDMTEPGSIRAAFRPTTRLVWVETPSNPLLRVTDIAAVAEIAHGSGARVVCDNTWATPVLCRPLELGADLVVHATTKYLGGHSDVLGGAVVTAAADDGFARIRSIQTTGGAVAAPFDCWLVLRGIRTLPHRVRAQSAGAMAVATFLEGHPSAERVHYPGLASHPAHQLAARQMTGFGGMLSLQVHGGADEALGVAARCRLFTRATSLGGVESLIEHRASTEPVGTSTPENLLRLSIGLEHPDDLIEDLDRALRA
jgi:cystathionine gamma-synthase